jgi:hypothetical protein
MDISAIDPHFQPGPDRFQPHPIAIGRPLDTPDDSEAFRNFVDSRLQAPARFFLRLSVGDREVNEWQRLPAYALFVACSTSQQKQCCRTVRPTDVLGLFVRR